MIEETQILSTGRTSVHYRYRTAGKVLSCVISEVTSREKSRGYTSSGVMATGNGMNLVTFGRCSSPIQNTVTLKSLIFCLCELCCEDHSQSKC